MRPQLLIWDWNGTILDDTSLTYSIANRMLAERGMQVLRDEQAYRTVFGFPIIEYYRRMGYTFETESYESVADEFIMHYEAGFPGCTLQPGVTDVIDRLRLRGYPQALLSATRLDQLESQVAFHGIGDKFTRILGLTDHFAHSKAALARSFIEEMQIPPRSALFIGDTDHDFEVASAIGCPCALIARGHQLREHLETLDAAVLGDCTELLSYLE